MIRKLLTWRLWWLCLLLWSLALWVRGREHRLASDVALQLGIDERQVLVESLPPPAPRTHGLVGASVEYLDVDPDQPGLAVIEAGLHLYATADHGASWRALGSEDWRPASRGAAWVEGALVAVGFDRKLRFSLDLGETWQPVESTEATQAGRYLPLVQVARTDEGVHVEISDAGGSSAWHPLARTEAGVRMGEPAHTGGALPHPSVTPIVSSELTGLQAWPIVWTTRRGPDGIWAGTARGPLFRPNATEAWLDRTGDLATPHIRAIHVSELNSDTLLARSAGGRLFRSTDRAKTWSELRVD